MIEAYPLKWPDGWKRSKYQQASRFGDHSLHGASSELMSQLRMLGARNIIINSNLELRLDGLPRNSQREPTDAGVVAYFKYEGNDQCIPCDKWNKISHNIWAIAKCIEALRGLERWGAKDMVRASFTGFKALPAPTSLYPRYFDDAIDFEQAKQRHHKLIKETHPDVGGSVEEFHEIQRQWEEYNKKELVNK